MIAAALLALICWIPLPQQGQDYLPWLLQRLESSDPEIRDSSFHALLAEPGAVEGCLLDFPSASPLARQIRARVLFERGGESHVDEALRLAEKDPDPAVRGEILRFLGRRELGAKSDAQRCALLGKAALDDGPPGEASLAILQKLELPCASAALLDLVRHHPGRPGRDAALKALLRRWTGGGELLTLANDPGAERSWLFPVLLVLGDRADTRAMSAFLRHWDDSDLRLRNAARQGFSSMTSRLAQRRETEEALAQFGALRRALGDRPEILLDEAYFALIHVAGSKDASGLAARCLQHLVGKKEREEVLLRGRAQLLLGASHFLRREVSQAERELSRAIETFRAILKDVHDFEEPEQGLLASTWLGKCWVLRALLATSAPDASSPAPASYWREAHEVSRRAQQYRNDWLSQLRKKSGTWPYNMDDIFSGELGAFALLEGPIVRDWGRDAAESLWRNMAAELTPLDEAEFPALAGGEIEDLPSVPDRDKRWPSDFPVRFADFLESALGKSEAALAVYRRLAQAWRMRLNDFPGFAQDVARVEARIGSLLMDRREGEEAEQALRRALGLLEDLVALLAARSGDATPDPQIQAQMGTVYVSLAVNENVVKARPEEARSYLEKAYTLDPSPFNRVLYACYEARAGHGETALRVLDQVDPEPTLFYNMACTAALLGKKERALDLLEKHLRVALRGAGERRRGAEWARKDPDLESLRGEKRFEALLREAEKELSKEK